ncbi:DoxX family protein [Streptomyces zaomyceticus]|uniref:DoxX family protein n=1 Tax=Streptomyces zaomyceticus TaxID=68286 RepID=UPI0036737666
MAISLTIAEVLFGAFFATSGTNHLLAGKGFATPVVRLGFSRSSRRLIGAAEVTGGIGLTVATWAPVTGIAAAVGLCLLVAASLQYHHWVQDTVMRCVAPTLVTALMLLDAVARLALLLTVPTARVA